MSANGIATTMDASEPSELDRKIALLEARRSKKKTEIELARKAQFAIDYEAFVALEEEHGEAVRMLEVSGFVPGVPTLIVVKSPGNTSFYSRYKDQVRRANKNAQAIGAAQEMLGQSCIVYPAEDALAEMLKQFPGAAISAGIEAIKLVELATEEEKKA